MTHATNSLSCQRRTPGDHRETRRKSDGHSMIARSAEPEVIPEAVDLMHALMPMARAAWSQGHAVGVC